MDRGAAGGTTSQVPEDLTGQPRRVLVGSVVLRRTFSAASSAPMLFLSAYGGSLADRHPKRRVLLVTQSSMMLLAFALSGLAFAGWLRPGFIIVVSTLSGIAMSFDMPARQSFLVEITSRQDLMNAISLNSAIVNSARVVGPAVAGLVMSRTSPAVCFFLNALSFIAVITGLLRMQLNDLPQTGSEQRRGHLREGFRHVLESRRLRIVFTLFAVVGVFGWSYSVLMPALATDVLHLRERGFGLLLGANGVGALAGALTTAAFGGSFPPRKLAFTGLYVFSGMLLIIGALPFRHVTMICLVFAGWGMMLFFSTINTVIQTSVPDSLRGRIMGIWALVFGGMTPLGSLQAGAISQYLGVIPALQVGACVCACAGAVTWWFTWRSPLAPGAAASPASE